MNYKLISSTIKDIDRLVHYKKKTIFEYAQNLSNEEIDRINSYVEKHVPLELKNYQNIVVDGAVVGCVLLVQKEDDMLLDEIYLEEKFRGAGIGTDIIKNVVKDNNVVNLWVYKQNERAISLYKKLGFVVVDETEQRYYMRREKK